MVKFCILVVITESFSEITIMNPSIIADLCPGNSQSMRGIVRARAGPRAMVMGGRACHLTTVTFMDESEDSICLVIWSNTDQEAGFLEQTVREGCVLDVLLPSVFALTGRSAEKNDPVTSSRFRMKFVTSKSQLKVVTGPPASLLSHLVRVPFRAASLALLVLEEVKSPMMRGKFCSLVAAVQCSLPEVVVNGQTVREVRLFDADSDTALIKLWESEQRRVAGGWVPRETVLLLSNVLVEFDAYRAINVLAGSSRTVITTNPEMWEARLVRQHALAATFSSQDRLRTFIAGTVFPLASCRIFTISELQELSSKGASSEAEALLYLAVMAKVTHTTLLESNSVMATCRGCGEQVTNFFEDLYDCGNFACQGGQGGHQLKYNVKIDLKDETGQLSGLEVAGSFLLHILDEPALWAELDTATREKTASLFLEGFVRFTLAVELPLSSHARPVRMIVVSAE